VSKALEQIRSYSQVLINARGSKLAALELVKSIRDQYKGAIKVFVYLPESSASEGSKFGLLGAEVEDELSIQRIVDKLPQANKRSYNIDEEIIAVYGMHGGAGASLLSTLIAYALGKSGLSSLLMELSPSASSIRDALVLETKPALLTRDRSKELDHSKDADWFSGFISRSHFLRETFYLHLFNSSAARDVFSLRAASFTEKISEQLLSISDRSSYYQHSADELEVALRAARSSLQLLSQELNGSSYSLFDEVLAPGSQLAKHFVVDLGSDISSPLNRQFLRFTKHLILLVRDNCTADLKTSLQGQIKHLEDSYNLNIIPVLAPGHHRYQDYYRFSASDWQSLLGLEPLLFPYQPELVSSFLLDHEELDDNSPLMEFVKSLISRIGIAETTNRKSLMEFLVRNA
jgi:cellulose biosynthesis protein BcsQ